MTLDSDIEKFYSVLIYEHKRLKGKINLIRQAIDFTKLADTQRKDNPSEAAYNLGTAMEIYKKAVWQ